MRGPAPQSGKQFVTQAIRQIKLCNTYANLSILDRQGLEIHSSGASYNKITMQEVVSIISVYLKMNDV